MRGGARASRCNCAAAGGQVVAASRGPPDRSARSGPVFCLDNGPHVWADVRIPSPMNIGVFLSASDLDERCTRPTRECAELIGGGGHTLVWGGSDTGLKVVADGVPASEGDSQASRSLFSE